MFIYFISMYNFRSKERIGVEKCSCEERLAKLPHPKTRYDGRGGNSGLDYGNSRKEETACTAKGNC